MKDLIGSADACDLLGIDRSTLTRWVQAGKVEPAAKMPGANGAYIFRRAEIDELTGERAR